MQHVCDMTRRKLPLSATETVRIIARLFDLYGIDRSPDRDRSRDGERFQRVLYYAVRDGLIRLPSKRGAPSKWQGKLGLELVEAVQAYRVANPTIRNGAPKLMSLAKAIQDLREQAKWNAYSSEDLEKRYHEAKKTWGYANRLMVLLDPWHEKRPEIYPENS
jgi:hypothetical protein